MDVVPGGTIESRGVRAVREALAGGAAVILVRAPLGFGKSSAVARATRDRDDVAWYSAEPWERDAPLAPLIDRLREIRADAGRTTLALAAQGTATPERLGAALAAELAHVDAPLVVVIDDAHHLDDGPFAALAGALIRRAPAGFRLVVITRTQPWAAIVEALAAGRARTVDADALRFDADDARALAGERGPSLATAALGWPLAVALAARTGAPDIPEALVGEVLVERMLRTLPAAHLDALVETAVYDAVEPQVLDPRGERGLARTFAALVAEGAMVTPAGAVFRVHPLLRDTVARLRAERDGGLAAAHAEASHVLAGAHRQRAALYHLTLAADPAADERYLRRHADAAIADGAIGAVRAALGRVLAVRPHAAVIPYVEGLLAKARGDDARDRFRAAAASDDAELAFRARLELVEIDLGRGRSVDDATIDALLAGSRAFGPAMEARVTIRAAWADAVANRFAAALERLDAVPDDGSLEIAIDAAPLAAYALTVLGAFDAGQRRLDEALERLGQTDALVATAAGLVWSARFALLRGATAQAYDEAREAARTGASFDLRAHAAALYVTLAEAAAHAGDAAVVREAAPKARQAAERAWYARDAERIAARALRMTARAALADGDYAAARDGLGAVAGTPVETAAARADAAAVATLARTPDAAALRARAATAFDGVAAFDALDAVTLREAADLVELLAAYAGERHIPTPDTGAFGDLLEARERTQSPRALGLALRALGERGPAEAVAAGLGAASAGGPTFGVLVALALAIPHAAHLAPHIGAVRALFADAPLLRPFAAAPVPSPGVEALTPREAEILALLAAGLSNKEIAQRLILGVRTVETHVARIAGKLGVSSRARAVARAVALGMVAVP